MYMFLVHIVLWVHSSCVLINSWSITTDHQAERPTDSGRPQLLPPSIHHHHLLCGDHHIIGVFFVLIITSSSSSLSRSSYHHHLPFVVILPFCSGHLSSTAIHVFIHGHLLVPSSAPVGVSCEPPLKNTVLPPTNFLIFYCSATFFMLVAMCHI